MPSVSRLYSVRPIVAGSIPLPVREFKQALGRVGFTVWVQLCALRDARGVCTATIAEIAGKKLRERYVKKGLEILRRMHLVESVKDVHAPQHRRARVVVGVVGRDMRGDVVLVHGDAWRSMQLAMRWGGNRQGAGNRKFIDTNQEPVSDRPHTDRSHSLEVEEGNCAIRMEHEEHPSTDCAIRMKTADDPTEVRHGSESTQDSFQEGPLTNQEGPLTAPDQSRGAVDPAENVRCGSDNRPLRSRGEQSAPYVVGGMRARALSRSDPLLTIQDVVSLHPESCAPKSGALDSSEVVGCGTRIPGRWDYPGVPPVPDQIKPVCIPHPPEVDPSRSAGEQVEVLARTWENAVSHRYLDGRDCWTFKRYGGAINSPHFRLLRGAIEQFVLHEIAPAAWLDFAFETWDTLGGEDAPDEKPKPRKGRRKKSGRKPPPLKWAFGPDFIAKWRGWFRRQEAATVLGGRLVFTPKHHELIHRHAVLRGRLVALDRPSTTQVRSEVHNVFPGGLYERLVEAVQIEVAQEQDSINHRIRNGGWVW